MRLRIGLAGSLLAAMLVVPGTAQANELGAQDPGVDVGSRKVGTSACYVLTPAFGAGFNQYGPYAYVGNAYVYCPLH